MTITDSLTRSPLRFKTVTSTVLIATAGYMGISLAPYMIAAVESGLGIDVVSASWVVTATLVLTAISGLVVAPLCAGRSRRLIARLGLVVSVAGFLGAALAPALIIPGLIVGGVGTGGAVAAGGAALASFRNPDRAAAVNGVSNQAIGTIILLIVPALGLAPISVFGTLAAFGAIALLSTAWLPAAPVTQVHAGAGMPEAIPLVIPETGAVRTPVTQSRTVTIAGFVLLVVVMLWAVSEQSLWSMIGYLGADQTGLTPEGLGIGLSLSSAGAIVGALLLVIVGNRLGRAVPLVVLLVVGSVLKIAQGYTADATTLIVLLVAWNTLTSVAFLYFIATAAALDADGRWSGWLFSIYLVGSAATPVIGAALAEALGYQAFTLVLGIATILLAIPAGVIAMISTRIEKSSVQLPEAAEGTAHGTTADTHRPPVRDVS